MPVSYTHLDVYKRQREDYLRKVEKLRAAVPGIGLTTDLIVSFPGETEKQFEDTCSLVREVGYDAAFTFIYSPREGTRAAAMEGRIPEAESTRRIEQLIREVEASTARVHQSMIGKHENVLVESLSKRDERKVSGKGTRGITVTLDGTEAVSYTHLALPPVRSKLTFVSPSVNSPSPTPTSSPMPGTPTIGSFAIGISWAKLSLTSTTASCRL